MFQIRRAPCTLLRRGLVLVQKQRLIRRLGGPVEGSCDGITAIPRSNLTNTKERRRRDDEEGRQGDAAAEREEEASKDEASVMSGGLQQTCVTFCSQILNASDPTITAFLQTSQTSQKESSGFYTNTC